MTTESGLLEFFVPYHALFVVNIFWFSYFQSVIIPLCIDIYLTFCRFVFLLNGDYCFVSDTFSQTILMHNGHNSPLLRLMARQLSWHDVIKVCVHLAPDRQPHQHLITHIWNWVMRCWCGCLSWARCRLFAYGPADATAIPKPHHLLPHWSPEWFDLSGISWPRGSWKTGC